MENEDKLVSALRFAEGSEYNDIRTHPEFTKEALEILYVSVEELTSILEEAVATTNELTDGERSILYRYIDALRNI